MLFLKCIAVSSLSGALIGIAAPVLHLYRFGLVDDLGKFAVLFGGIIGLLTGAILGGVLFPLVIRSRPGIFWMIVVLVSYTTCILSACSISYESGPPRIWVNGVLSVLVVTAIYVPVGLVMKNKDRNP